MGSNEEGRHARQLKAGGSRDWAAAFLSQVLALISTSGENRTELKDEIKFEIYLRVAYLKFIQGVNVSHASRDLASGPQASYLNISWPIVRITQLPASLRSGLSPTRRLGDRAFMHCSNFLSPHSSWLFSLQAVSLLTLHQCHYVRTSRH